jgi:dienelactone hydrolase
MTTIALFPSVLGVRRGVLDAAERLRGDGHEVLVADLYDGRTFDDYPPRRSSGTRSSCAARATPSRGCPTAS